MLALSTRCLTAAVLASIAGIAAPSAAQIITQWNFNVVGGNPGGSTTGTLVSSTGTGSIFRFGTPNLAFRSGSADGGSSDTAPDLDNAALDLSPWAQQSVGSGLNGVRFTTSTAGYTRIVVSFDIRHSNRMSRWVQFQYTTDGTNFTSAGIANNGLFEASNDGDVWYNGRVADLSSITGVENNPNFGFRIVAVFAPSLNVYLTSGAVPYNNGGRARIDMVTVRQDLLGANPTIEADTLPRAACAFGVGGILIEGETRPGVAPFSTDITVTADLTSIGGSATQQLFDDGTNGDPTPNDGRFSYFAPIGSDITAGQKSVQLTVRDAQGREAIDSENFNVVDCAGDSGSPMVISQIFGGGGNFGADYNSDFVEIHNRSSEAYDLSGHSLQYASDSGTFDVPDNVALFPNGTIIPPGAFYLIQVNSTIGQYGAPFIPDLALNPGFGVGQTNGKLALVNSTTLLGGECPTANPLVLDFVGFGQAANCSEGGSPTLNTNVNRAALRKNGGCLDSNQNFADFELQLPNPRTLADTPVDCGAACAADFNGDGGIDGGDVESFFVAWAAAESTADVNADGGVDGGDVEAFFVVWSAGGC
jgi:hypothetical protein